MWTSWFLRESQTTNLLDQSFPLQKHVSRLLKFWLVTLFPTPNNSDYQTKNINLGHGDRAVKAKLGYEEHCILQKYLYRGTELLVDLGSLELLDALFTRTLK
jgi:hypothetical protein